MTTLVMSEVLQSTKEFKLKLDLIKTLSCLGKHRLFQYFSFPRYSAVLLPSSLQCKQNQSQYFALKAENNRTNPVLAEGLPVTHQIFVSLQTAIMVRLILVFAAVIKYVYGRPALPPLPMKGEHFICAHTFLIYVYVQYILYTNQSAKCRFCLPS